MRARRFTPIALRVVPVSTPALMKMPWVGGQKCNKSQERLYWKTVNLTTEHAEGTEILIFAICLTPIKFEEM